MPVTTDDFVHENNGAMSSGSTSIVVSLAGADSTTAGNTVLVFMSLQSAVGITPPTGFVQDVSRYGGQFLVFRKSEVAAAETSWTFTSASSNFATWYVVEMSNIDPVEPLDVNAFGATLFTATANGATISTGTTVQNASLSSVQFAAFMSVRVSSSSVQSFSGYTNDFEEVADNPGNASLNAPTIAVARNFRDGTTSTFESTATFASTGGTANAGAIMVVYRAANSPIVAPLTHIAGFEWGTHAGITATTGATSMMGNTLAHSGTWNTAYLIQAGSARNSSYGLRLVQSASAAAIRVGTLSVAAASAGFNVRVVSATGTVIVASFLTSAGSTLGRMEYDTSTSKFGWRCSTTGTVSWQTGTTATNTWVWVDVRAKFNTSTWHIDWKIEGGASDGEAAAELTGQTPQTIGCFNLGTGISQTMTADFDDVVTSASYAAYPLGAHQVRLLVPETTGASVSGTSANFSEFTANGTLAAFASTSGQRIDEVPPTISASSDGVVQTAAAASDYMNFPMTTYTCASDEIIAAVRAYFSEWGGTGTGTGTIGYRGHDGTTEATFVAASAFYDPDSLTAASSTYPLWKAAMWVNTWTQAKLDAAALRVGFSTDATPDMGISAAYLEVAIRKAPLYRAHTVEDAAMTADLYVHPYNSAVVSYVITNNDPTRTATFSYDIAGTPQTPVTVAPGAGPQTLTLNADAFGDISNTTLTA